MLLFRIADAFLLEKLYLCGITATPPHRDIHKTALGAEEHVAWEKVQNTPTILMQLKGAGYTIGAIEQTDVSKALHHFTCCPTKRYAVVFGHEVFGVQETVLSAHKQIALFPDVKAHENEYCYAASYYAGYIALKHEDYTTALDDLMQASKNVTYQSVVPYLVLQVYYRQKKFHELLNYIHEVKHTEIRLKGKDEIALRSQRLIQGSEQELRYRVLTQRAAIACDAAWITTLFMHGINAYQQSADREVPVLVGVEDTQLQYLLPSVKEGYIKTVLALRITITTRPKLPALPSPYFPRLVVGI